MTELVLLIVVVVAFAVMASRIDNTNRALDRAKQERDELHRQLDVVTATLARARPAPPVRPWSRAPSSSSSSPSLSSSSSPLVVADALPDPSLAMLVHMSMLPAAEPASHCTPHAAPVTHAPCDPASSFDCSPSFDCSFGSFGD